MNLESPSPLHETPSRPRCAAIVVATLLAAGLFAPVAPRIARAGEEATLTAAAAQTITARDLHGHVAFLSSEELEGRGLGLPGGRVTQRYLASWYTRLGLLPAGENGTFLQAFDVRGDRVGRNVLAMIPGSDPVLAEEIVVVAGHFDHLGRGRGGDGPVYNGADDNASGTAAILEIAEAFTAAPPRRTVVFFNTDGEESGLLGSKAWLEEPTFPVDRVVTMLCMDMIGRSEEDYVFVGGAGTSPGFGDLVRKATARQGLAPEIADGGRAPTDSAGFYAADIPVLFFFTNLHDDYHMPGDDIEKVNFDGLERIARLIFDVAKSIADADATPEFTKSDASALPADFMERMRSRMAKARASSPYLGVRPSDDSEGEGCLVGGVTEDSPAAAAGIREGDRILAIGDVSIESFRDLRRALGRGSIGDEIEIKVTREGQEMTVSATLGKFPESR